MTYSKSFPVKFESGGDTTRDAFNKHIQEFDAVYGILNELSGAMPSEEEMSTLKTGSISVSRLTGNWPASRLTGSIPAAQVSGSLDSATIPRANVTGLEAFVNGLIDGKGSSGTGITVIYNTSVNGYAKFGNDLILQWGNLSLSAGETIRTAEVTFPVKFTQGCYGVTITIQQSTSAASDTGVTGVLAGSPTVSGFQARIVPAQSGIEKIYWTAIGV